VHVASEVALVVVLALTLGISWRDGLPSDDTGLASGPSSDLVASHAAGSGLASGDSVGNGVSVGSYFVPGPRARPIQILIPALDVHRPVEGVGIDQSGVLNLPVNFWNAGWFEYGPVPGAPGDAVIEGHSGYPGKPLIFGNLYQLKRGDQIIVVLADRSRRLFIVDSKTTVPQGSAPAGLAYPYGPPRLTLITCTGYFDKNAYSYTSRLVLEARYAGLA
jgi:LPXTG-site transpeptidase (sortase) family protein